MAQSKIEILTTQEWIASDKKELCGKTLITVGIQRINSHHEHQWIAKYNKNTGWKFIQRPHGIIDK